MSVFTPAEIAYLQSQPLGRLATVGPDGQPHVVPMGFRINTDLGTLDIGGLHVSQTKKWRDIARNPLIAFVVDDIASRDPWRVRMLEIRGEAELLETGGKSILPRFEDPLIRIHPRRVVAFGIESENSPVNARSVG